MHWSAFMETAPATSTKSSNRSYNSCIRCSDRKVKCDRHSPCSACVKHNVRCVVRSLQLPRKRAKRAKDGILNDRLKRYEALLEEQGIDTTKLSDTSQLDRPSEPSHSEGTMPEDVSQLPTPVSTIYETQQNVTKTQLLHGQGRSKLVDKWVCLRHIISSS